MFEVRTMVSKVSSNRATPLKQKYQPVDVPLQKILGYDDIQLRGPVVQFRPGPVVEQPLLLKKLQTMDRSFSASTKNGTPLQLYIYCKLVCEYSRLILSFVIAISYIYIYTQWGLKTNL